MNKINGLIEQVRKTTAYWNKCEQDFCINLNDHSIIAKRVVDNPEHFLDLHELVEILETHSVNSAKTIYPTNDSEEYRYGNFFVIREERYPLITVRCGIFDDLGDKHEICSTVRDLDLDKNLDQEQNIVYPRLLPHVVFLQEYVSLVNLKIEEMGNNFREELEDQLLEIVKNRDSCTRKFGEKNVS